MKQVRIFVKASCDYKNNKETYYIALLKYKQHEKVLTGSGPNLTVNKGMILAILLALENLKEPCKVIIYTCTAIGVKKQLKSINKVYLANMFKTINRLGHLAEFKVSRANRDRLNEEILILKNISINSSIS